MIDRERMTRALAKALAFKAAGKDATAQAWAERLVRALREADILRPDMESFSVAEAAEIDEHAGGAS